MSCNGCRVLRKGCSEGCVLRHCLQCIDSPEAQAHATLFVTKFFGRAGLTGFITGVAENQRPALFQSLLYEACGRTVNPVYGAVGLLFSGKWAVCQAAVETVLRGGSPKPAAVDMSTNHMKPNSTSALTDHPGCSVSTLDPPAGFNIATSAALINDLKHTPRLPAHESSLATSTSSFKASSFHAADNQCVLDFSNYSASSSAEEMIKGSQLNKRGRDGKPDMIVNEDLMLKRARSSFLSGFSAAAAVARPYDAVQFAARRSSNNTTWIEGFSKANCRGIGSNECITNYDMYVPTGRGSHVGLGAEIKLAPHIGELANASNGMTEQGTHHKQVIAPVARRVLYIPPPMKQALNNGGVQMNKKRLSNEGGVAGDDHQARPHMQSVREESIPSISCSVHQDTMQDTYGDRDAVDIELNLGLQAQHNMKLCCADHGELVNNNSPHDTLQLVKHKEPHVLLRMSSPSVTSEGSVNTLVGCLDRSSCTALETPKDGVKLLNLLL